MPQDFQEGPASSLEGGASDQPPAEVLAGPTDTPDLTWDGGSLSAWRENVGPQRHRTLWLCHLGAPARGGWGAPGSRTHWRSPGDENAHSRPRAHPRGERDGRLLAQHGQLVPSGA